MSARATARQALLTGFALTIPVFVTLLVIGFVVNSLSNILDPFVAFAFELSGTRLQPSETPPVVVKLVALLVLLTTIFCLGFVAERRSGQGRIESLVDATVKRVPGVGSLYTSFDEMSEMLLDSDTQSFQEVVLVEHPTENAYTVAFVTASTPAAIERATDNEAMVTLFMPMAPNPVMGGHVVHVPSSRVHDVDMTVEEGVRSIVTSGVAIGEGSVQTPIGGTEAAGGYHVPPQAGVESRGAVEGPSEPTREREAAYRDDVDPEHARTPQTITGEDDTATVGSDADRPSDLDSEAETLGDDTAHPDSFEQSEGTVGPTMDTPADVESEREEQN